MSVNGYERVIIKTDDDVEVAVVYARPDETLTSLRCKIERQVELDMIMKSADVVSAQDLSLECFVHSIKNSKKSDLLIVGATGLILTFLSTVWDDVLSGISHPPTRKNLFFVVDVEKSGNFDPDIAAACLLIGKKDLSRYEKAVYLLGPTGVDLKASREK